MESLRVLKWRPSKQLKPTGGRLHEIGRAWRLALKEVLWVPAGPNFKTLISSQSTLNQTPVPRIQNCESYRTSVHASRRNIELLLDWASKFWIQPGWCDDERTEDRALGCDDKDAPHHLLLAVLTPVEYLPVGRPDLSAALRLTARRLLLEPVSGSASPTSAKLL